MRMRLWILVFLIALTTTSYADDKGIANIADGIASYRLSASFCHWPIPPKISQVLDSDEDHFRNKNPQAFDAGVKDGTERFHLLAKSDADYCQEIKESRAAMTQSLAGRAK